MLLCERSCWAESKARILPVSSEQSCPKRRATDKCLQGRVYRLSYGQSEWEESRCRLKLTGSSSEVEIAVCVACIATLRPLFTRKAMKQSRKKPIFNESQMQLNYIKVSNDLRKQDKWTGQNLDNTDATYSTKASGDNAHDDGLQMENVAGIRRVIDVDVTV